jgi:anti-sigma-K factor RskA
MSTLAENLQDLTALHAFDLLEGAEKTRFEQELAADPALRALVADLRETSASLALTASGPTPSARLRSRVMASITTATRPSASPSPATPTPAAAEIIRPAMSAWYGWAAAAALAVSTVWFGTQSLQLRSQVAAARDLAALAEIERTSLAQALEAERLVSVGQLASLQQSQRQVTDLRLADDIAQLKISSLASLLGDNPEAQAIAVWNPTQQRGVLTVAKLPPLAADQDYQLWVVDPAYENPVDGGVFTVDAATGEARLEFTVNQPVETVAKFAVSLERKGGVPKAEGPMVLLSL